ncbi:MAG: type I DNA topoisomerase [Oscillospiraceae bacterium]
METDLDKIEAGKMAWKDVLREYYKDFDANLNNAEIQLEGKHLKVPDEESDEVCPNCGRKLVYKNGRFGRFLACPGYPECSFTMPIVVEMPGKCPACGGRLLKRTSRKGFAYYACERGHDCPGHGEGEGGENIQGFMTWDVPTKDYALSAARPCSSAPAREPTSRFASTPSARTICRPTSAATSASRNRRTTRPNPRLRPSRNPRRRSRRPRSRLRRNPLQKSLLPKSPQRRKRPPRNRPQKRRRNPRRKHNWKGGLTGRLFRGGTL